VIGVILLLNKAQEVLSIYQKINMRKKLRKDLMLNNNNINTVIKTMKVLYVFIDIYNLMVFYI